MASRLSTVVIDGEIAVPGCAVTCEMGLASATESQDSCLGYRFGAVSRSSGVR